jgi:hypothetical protein
MSINNLKDFYTKLVYEEWGAYASWPIGSKINLGDYGRLDGYRFVVEGNIKDFGVNVTGFKSKVNLFFELKSSGVKEMRTKGEIVVNDDTKFVSRITFQEEESIYFRSIKLNYNCINNIAEVNRKIIGNFKNGTWDGKWAFVSSLFESGGTTIIISNNKGASIEVEANASAGKIDLADADIQFFVKSEENIGVKIIANRGLIPLLHLSQIRPRIKFLSFLGFDNRTVQPLLLSTRDEIEPVHSIELPGHEITKFDTEISPKVAERLEKDIDDVFHIIEI